MLRSGARVPLLCLVTACSAPGPAFVKLPELPAETRSVIAAAFLDGSWKIQAANVRPAEELTLRLDDIPAGAWDSPERALYLAAYPHALERLRFAEGELTESAAQNSRLIPAAMREYQLDSDHLEAVDELPETLRRVRLEMTTGAGGDPRSIRAVGVGRAFTCILRADGSVSCWGENGQRQLGVRTPPRAPEPLELEGVKLAGLAVGADSACGLEAAGRVSCWGEYTSGQLGRRDASNSDVGPKPVAGIDDAVGLATQWSHTCAVRASGEVMCWGGNPSGGADPESTVDIAEPTIVRGLPPIVEVAVGLGYSCGLASMGEVWCWGGDSGPPGTGSAGRAPSRVDGLGDVVELTSGSSHVCVRRSGGSVECWRTGSAGQLGTPDDEGSARPVESSLGAFTGKLVAGAFATCVVGAVSTHCTGASTNLGLEVEPLDELPEGVHALGLGSGDHACAATASSLLCWGRADSGQLGVIPIPRSASAVDVPGVVDAASVALSQNDSCYTRRNGESLCFGAKQTGLFPDSIAATHPSPIPVALSVAHLAIGAAHGCVQTSTPAGALYCWGTNSVGQLGVGDTTPYPEARRVPSVDAATTLSASELISCATFTGGDLRCWGSNKYFKLGLSATDEELIRTSPTRVDLPGASFVAAGGEHVCAVSGAEGNVFCWGENMDGQLGTRSMGRRPIPDQARSIEHAVDVGAGERHTCARVAGGSVECWGRNDEGQVGAPLGTPRLWEAARVAGISGAVSIAVGGRHNCALIDSGSVMCFGANDFGQLGDGGFEHRSDPRPVVGLSDAVAISAGSRHTCVARRNGQVSCWGADTDGQLGLGTRTVFEQAIEVPIP